MGRVVILEGPDGGGKTALADRLVQRYGFAYRHEGPPRGSNVSLLHRYGRKLERAAYGHGHRGVVFDRFHVGETVYGPVARGEDQVGRDGLTVMDRLLTATDSRLVFCLPPFSACLDVWSRRHAAGEEFITSKRNLRRVYDLYAKYAATHPNRMIYDWRNVDQEKTVLGYCTGPRRRLPRHVTGSPWASVLFVGERVNRSLEIAGLDLPFFDNNGSSAYLNDCLRRAGFVETEMAFVNALWPGGRRRDLNKVLEELPRVKVVVALGKVAEEVIMRQRIYLRFTWYPLEHPQHRKRFHHHRRAPYLRRLREIRRKLDED